MAKNKNQKQPAKQQTRPGGQDMPKGSTETSDDRPSQSPSPLDMAHKSKSKRFGHN
ncbi:hypothetical protein BX286_2162 [Streptomyces sp. 3211.6]|uniref:hypothetical protein n=1 Tax=Streptomyces TaxID=1883 RepID=UPI000CBCBECA|nr:MULTISPECIES: hypothetical protein [Streptomyces]RKT04214.1 hypothetical protein BX286_2162 [Streptomyces sp. 3211.6]RPF40097.1 hypothetical protein EDD96_3850 [Streptomyces sp. Ag109_G2-6]